MGRGARVAALTASAACHRCGRTALAPKRWSSSSASPRPQRNKEAAQPTQPSPVLKAGIGRRQTTAPPTPPRLSTPTAPSSPSSSPTPTLHAATRTSLYSWGSGAFGGLGCSSYRPHLSPQVVSALSNLPSPVTAIASGWTSNLALTASGGVYHWGYKPFLRSLSLTAKLHNRVPNFLASLQSLNLGRFTLSNAVTTPTPLSAFASNPAVRLSCGGDAAAIVDAEGRLWTFGSGFFGQLGHSPSLSDSLLRQPKLVDSLVRAGVRVRDVACGFNHTLVLAEDGSVYVCGKHDHGALGIGRVNKEGKRLFFPHLVPSTATSPSAPLSLDPAEVADPNKTVASLLPAPQSIGEVVQVSAGMKHSLLLTRDGRVYASGHNQFGQCGFSPLDVSGVALPSSSAPSSASTFLSLSTFTRVSALRHERIMQVSAGQHHSLFLSDSGRVFACGLNQQSQCGQASALSTLRHSSALSAYTQKQFECVAEPREVELGESFHCVKVVAGFYDSAMVGRDGRLRWWGGRMKQTGERGNVEGVMAGQRVRDVSFGLVHSLLLTEEEEREGEVQRAAAVPGSPLGEQSGTASDPRPAWY